MPLFIYKARASKGKVVEGKVEAPSETAAAEILAEKGLDILVLSKTKKSSLIQSIEDQLNRVSARDLVIFTRQLSVEVSANVPLVQALRVLIRQTSSVKLKMILAEVTAEVDGGARLSQALSRFPDVFNELYTNIIKSGETSGRLDEVLNYLADEQERDYDLTKKIQGIMAYPIIVFILLLLVGGFILVLAVPHLTNFFSEAKAELPLVTRALIGFSDFVASYWWLIILIILVVVVSLRFYVKTERGRRKTDRLKLKIPVFGGLYQKIFLVRFARSMATLMRGGVRVTQSLQIAAKVVNNMVYYDIIMKAAKEVEGGNSISMVFAQSKEVPLMVSQMLAIGEETGKVDQVLEKMSNFYSREVDNLVNNLIRLIEPIIIIIMGVVVAIVYASVMIPMFRLSHII